MMTHATTNRFGALAFGVLMAILGSACGTGPLAGPGMVSPEDGATPDQPEGLAEGDSADELDARKDKLVLQLRGLHEPASTDPEQCQGLCSLATSICGVTEKLCNIAEDHAGDDHYEDLCREAKRECQEAQQDCVACVEGLQDGGATDAGPGDAPSDESPSGEAGTAAARDAGASEAAGEKSPASDSPKAD